LFKTWWYFSVLSVQFFAGVMSIYLYAWLKSEIEAREREKEIKAVTGKIEIPDNLLSICA